MVDNQAGDFLSIGPDLPHEVFNLSAIEPVIAAFPHSDADEWQTIVPSDRDCEGLIDPATIVEWASRPSAQAYGETPRAVSRMIRSTTSSKRPSRS